MYSCYWLLGDTVISTCLESLGSSHYSVSTCTTVWITQSLSLSLISLSLSQILSEHLLSPRPPDLFLCTPSLRASCQALLHQAHTHLSPLTHKMAAQCRHILASLPCFLGLASLVPMLSLINPPYLLSWYSLPAGWISHCVKLLAGPSDSMTMLVTHLLVSIATATLFVVGLSEREAAQGTAFELVWWTRLI